MPRSYRPKFENVKESMGRFMQNYKSSLRSRYGSFNNESGQFSLEGGIAGALVILPVIDLIGPRWLFNDGWKFAVYYPGLAMGMAAYYVFRQPTPSESALAQQQGQIDALKTQYKNDISALRKEIEKVGTDGEAREKRYTDSVKELKEEVKEIARG